MVHWCIYLNKHTCLEMAEKNRCGVVQGVNDINHDVVSADNATIVRIRSTWAPFLSTVAAKKINVFTDAPDGYGAAFGPVVACLLHYLSSSPSPLQPSYPPGR